MSTTVDNRVVEMRFDNKQFESNVQTSMATLEKLKQSLNLSGAAKGLEDVNAAAKQIDMNGLGKGVETLRARFSALQVMGVTALANITNSAINAGKRIASALTIEPILTGFSEYETQINAIQTILANTKSKGSTLDDVNKALDELNTYADKTIYNFTEMTRNIGTFTAAGVDLDKSVTSIKGIANLAAVSGSTSQQASTVMYQLSQALAAGKVQLMDWNSVVNGGMGGELFQNALKRTAKNMGTDVDALIKKYGSFRESLTRGNWLTAEVLTETLTQLSGAYTEAELIEQGYTKKQAKEIADLADTAVNAATKVKTFTQLWDTLKEAAQSGWTQTWEIIIGDFEEAKELLTSISDVIGNMIGESAQRRNDLLQGWKDLGGRTALLDGLKAAGEGLIDVLRVIGEAFRECFPQVTSEQLYNLTNGFKEFMVSIKPSAETLEQIKSVASGLFSVFGVLARAVGAVLPPLLKFTTIVTGTLAKALLMVTSFIGDLVTAITVGLNGGDFFKALSDGLLNYGTSLGNYYKNIIEGFKGFGSIFTSIGDLIINVAEKVGNVFQWLADNVSFDNIVNGIFAVTAILGAKQMSDAIGNITEVLGAFKEGGILRILFRGVGDGKDDGEKKGEKTLSIIGHFKDVLGGVREALDSFSDGIKVGTIVSVAVAIGILSASLSVISKIKVEDVIKSLGAIGTMMAMLNLTFKSVLKSLASFDAKGIVKAGVSLMLMATAISIFASAMKKIAGLSIEDVAKGLVSLGAGMAILIKALDVIEDVKVSLKSTVAIVVLAQSCKTLANALSKFAGLSWDEIARGLVAMGGALAELVGTLYLLDKFSGKKSIVGSASLLIAVQSLGEMAEALKVFGSMSWDEVKQGLVAMGGALTEVAVVSGTLGKLAGLSGVVGAVTISIIGKSLLPIAKALSKLGNMSWSNVKRSLVAMGGALTEVAVVSGTLGKLAGFSGILGATAIAVISDALKPIADALVDIGMLAWDEIARGLVGMGGALTELAAVSGVLGKLAGLSGILGATTILVGVKALQPIADALNSVGLLSWDEVKQGLVAMGGALTEVAVVSGALGILAGPASLLGSGTLVIAAQGLGKIADAFKKFGEMNWDQIKQGLAAMGGALGETAIGGFLNTFAIIGAQSIAAMAEPLGMLADSIKKWSGVKLPGDLGSQLTNLSDAVGSFNFTGWGADAIAAVAEPLGTMADSISKWSGITIPENLGTQIGALADGIGKFNFTGLGADSLSSAAGPLGTMADSVKKWTGVSVPEGLGGQLSDLADGVKAFAWDWGGSDSLASVAEPLGALAASIKKWSGVTIPDGFKDKLSGLADGIKAFSWDWGASGSISSVAEPLGSLADSVKKWSGVTIPEGFNDQLSGLASSVKSFNGIVFPSDLGSNLSSLADGVTKVSNINAENLAKVTKSIKNVGKAAQTLSSIDFSGATSKLDGFASSINNINLSTDSFSNLGKNIVNSFVKSIDGGKDQVKESVTSLAKSAVNAFTKGVSGTDSKGSTAGAKLISSFAKGMKSKQGTATSAAKSITDALAKAVSSKENTFNTSGKNAMVKFISGINDKKSHIETSMSSALKSAISAIRGYYDDFNSAGRYLGAGLVIGIRSKEADAYNAGYRLGQKAAEGEKRGQDSNSPSKLTIQAGKWLGEGLVIGIQKMERKAYDAGFGLGDSAVKSISTSLSNIPKILNGDVDVQPTIRPVVDLTNVKSSASTISSMFGGPQLVAATANVNAIGSMMSRRNQNGAQTEIVSAIDKLRKDVGNLEKPTYNIGNIAYENGDAVSDAIEVLTQALRIGRRN